MATSNETSIEVLHVMFEQWKEEQHEEQEADRVRWLMPPIS